MTRCTLYLALSTILCLVVVTSARAVGDLDQSFEINTDVGLFQAHPFTDPYSGAELKAAQTFTVGVDGLLACIEVNVLNYGSTTPLILEVQATTNGLPDGTVLASASLDPGDIPLLDQSYVNFDLTESDLMVSPGDVLAIVLRNPGASGYSCWGHCCSSDTYPGGQGLTKDGDDPWQIYSFGLDYGFRTYVLSDADGDGLSDADELALGTDPNDPDTDHDGLSDFTEVDTAVDGCPDPLNPDSDGDTLLDGDEVALGTSPCSADTDGDGIPDQVDPDPVNPGEFDSELQAVTLVVALGIQATDLSLFNGPNANANAGRRNSLANRCSSAARKIGDGDFDAAIALLEGVLAKIDGDESEPDWMDASDEKAALAADVSLLITLLM